MVRVGRGTAESRCVFWWKVGQDGPVELISLDRDYSAGGWNLKTALSRELLGRRYPSRPHPPEVTIPLAGLSGTEAILMNHGSISEGKTR